MDILHGGGQSRHARHKFKRRSAGRGMERKIERARDCIAVRVFLYTPQEDLLVKFLAFLPSCTPPPPRPTSYYLHSYFFVKIDQNA